MSEDLSSLRTIVFHGIDNCLRTPALKKSNGDHKLRWLSDICSDAVDRVERSAAVSRDPVWAISNKLAYNTLE